MKNQTPFLRLHFIVLLWGFTGVVGKWITLSALPLVWYRLGIASLAVLLYLTITKKWIRFNPQFFSQLMGIGFIIALHWMCFFYSIKISTLAIALSTLSTGALFTALLEPIAFKRSLRASEIILSLIVSACIFVIFKAETEYWQGIVVGLICSFLSAVFSIFNAKLHFKASATYIMGIELIGGWILISLLIPIISDIDSLYQLSSTDFWALILLGIGLTAFPMIESVDLMKHFSPFTILLTVNLEPIYGIIIGFLIWKDEEKMSPVFYIATAVILLAVIGNAWYQKYILHKKSPEKQGFIS